MDENKELWKKCVEFHGHECGGLTIGYKACLYIIKLFNLSPAPSGTPGCISSDEQLVCISENDACGVDAVQVILGCSIGKGNLLFRIRGKAAFSFFDRRTGKSVRLVMKPLPEGMTREESFEYLQGLDPEDMFEAKDTFISVPEKAHLFDSFKCECCGESTGSNWIRIMNGKRVCLDCFEIYNRFDV